MLLFTEELVLNMSIYVWGRGIKEVEKVSADRTYLALGPQGRFSLGSFIRHAWGLVFSPYLQPG